MSVLRGSWTRQKPSPWVVSGPQMVFPPHPRLTHCDKAGCYLSSFGPQRAHQMKRDCTFPWSSAVFSQCQQALFKLWAQPLGLIRPQRTNAWKLAHDGPALVFRHRWGMRSQNLLQNKNECNSHSSSNRNSSALNTWTVSLECPIYKEILKISAVSSTHIDTFFFGN